MVSLKPVGIYARNGNYPMGPHTFDIGEDEEEEDDFLAASWASSKTVCSDAFDFLFDEKNMNPENVLEKHPDVIEVKPDKDFGKVSTLPDVSTYLEIKSVKDIETATKALLFPEQNESRVTKTDAIETVDEQLLKQSTKY